MTFPMPQLARGFRSPMAIDRTDVRSSGSTSTNHTFNSVAFGDPSEGRLVVAALNIGMQGEAVRNFVSGSIGGVAVELLAPNIQNWHTNDTFLLQTLFGAVVPTGTQGTITFSFSSTVAVHLLVFAIYGAENLLPDEVSQDERSGSTSLSLAGLIKPGGLSLAIAGSFGAGGNNFGFSQFSKDYDANVVGSTRTAAAFRQSAGAFAETVTLSSSVNRSAATALTWRAAA